jgi:hypothetical protein
MEGKWTTNSNSMWHFHCWNLTPSQNIFFWTINLTQPYAKQTACQTSQEMRPKKLKNYWAGWHCQNHPSWVLVLFLFW